MRKLKIYKYEVVDTNGNPEHITAHTYDVTDGYVNFDFIGVGLIASFYKPVSVVLYKEVEDDEKA